jgi:hypothetical protein
MLPERHETPVVSLTSHEPSAPQCSHRYPSNRWVLVYDYTVNLSVYDFHQAHRKRDRETRRVEIKVARELLELETEHDELESENERLWNQLQAPNQRNDVDDKLVHQVENDIKHHEADFVTKLNGSCLENEFQKRVTFVYNPSSIFLSPLFLEQKAQE